MSFISGELFTAQELKVLFKLAQIIYREVASSPTECSCLQDKAKLLYSGLQPHKTVQGTTASSDR